MINILQVTLSCTFIKLNQSVIFHQKNKTLLKVNPHWKYNNFLLKIYCKFFMNLEQHQNLKEMCFRRSLYSKNLKFK